MKLVIAGSRDFTRFKFSLLDNALNEFRLDPRMIISGGAKGIDTLAKEYALWLRVPFEEVKPDYVKYASNKRYAPIARNEVMAQMGDALLLVWNGLPKTGSFNMREQMLTLKKPVFEIVFRSTLGE